MAGKSVYKIAHEGGACNSSGTPVQVFLNDDNSLSAYCFSCCKPVSLGDDYKRPDNIKVKTDEEMLAELEVVRSCPRPETPFRSISPEMYKMYGVRLMVSEFDGTTPYALALPYTLDGKIVQFKIRTLEHKKMWWVGKKQEAGVDLFGWELAKRSGAKTIYITEGEFDAIALQQILQEMDKGTAYAGRKFAVVSIPNGVHSALEALERQGEELDSRFDEVVLVFDDDLEGQKAAKEIANLYPDTLSVRLPEKDANDCLAKGKLKAARDAVIFRASKPEFNDVASFADYEDEALEEVVIGFSLPWDGVTDITYGLRHTELIAIGGGTGSGKTLLAHEISAWFAKEHDALLLLAMMEETPRETVRNISGKVDNVPYHVPNTEYDKELCRKTIRSLDPNIDLWLPENQTSPDETWNSIKRAITTLVSKRTRLDPDHQKPCVVIVDNMTTLSEGLDSSARNDFIGKVVGEANQIRLKHNIIIIFLSHLNPPDSKSRSHENGAPVLESQFTGSRAMQRYCTFMIGFVRNKKAVDNSCSYIEVLKNRLYGRTGAVKTYYVRNTGRLLQNSWAEEQFKDKDIVKTG